METRPEGSTAGSAEGRGEGSPAAGPSILVGVAGWSYPDWRGCFYPRRRDSVPDLARVAKVFDCLELNVPFYRVPEPRMAEGWLRAVETKPGFLFTSKVPKALTHDRKLPLDDLSRLAAELREGLRPLAEAGRLAAVLLQFPFYFRDSPESRERIRRLVDALRPFPACVEVRSLGFLFGPSGRELAAGPGSALRFLEELGAGIVNIDIPSGRGTVPPTSINTSALGYVRLHGRNSEAWFDPRAGRDEKYSYLYSPDELAEWKERIVKVAWRTERTLVILNNHFRAQAPANALELLHLLGRTDLAAPAELLAAFPALARRLGQASSSPAPAAAPPAMPAQVEGRTGSGGREP